MSSFSHYSVLLHESVDGLNIKEDGIYFDCTAGGGGHSLEIAKHLSKNGKLIAIAAVLVLIAIGFFIPVLLEYVKTGLVPKFPTLIACGFVVIAAIQSFFTGLLLESIRHKDKQDFEMDLIHIQNNFNRLKNL